MVDICRLMSNGVRFLDNCTYEVKAFSSIIVAFADFTWKCDKCSRRLNLTTHVLVTNCLKTCEKAQMT